MASNPSEQSIVLFVGEKTDEGWDADIASRISLPLCKQGTSEEALPMLFVGSLSAAESLPFLREHKITHILTVASDLEVKIPPKCHAIDHLVVECHDHPMANILEVLPTCLDFIGAALESPVQGGGSGGRILVHCASGVSRSVTACAAFLMVRFNIKSSEALASIVNVRIYARPNTGFKRQLRILDQCKGDVREASRVYLKQTKSVVEDTLRQRETVNILHAKVDALEVKLASAKSSGQLEELDGIMKSLILLQSDLDSCLPTGSEGLADPSARMVRKAAVAKIERLLKLQEGNETL